MWEIIKHNFRLLQFFKEKEARKLPLRVLWQSFRLMQNEKITKIDGQIFINNYAPPFPSEASKLYFQSYKGMSEGKFDPQTAVISVTNRCNCNCEICYNKKHEGAELSLSHIKKVIRDVQGLGFFRISLSGGEPTLREDLEEIIKTIGTRSSSVLLTNGAGLTNEKIYSLKEAGLKIIKISLDHYKREEMDRKRCFPGAFEKAISAIKMSKEAGLYVAVTIVITKDILDSGEIYRYIDFVEELGADEVFIMEPKPYLCLNKNYAISSNDREKLSKIHLEINRDRKRRIKVFVYNYYTSSNCFGCNAGSRYLYIDATGNVSPCPSVGLGFGNIKDKSISEIYNRMKEKLSRPRKNCLFMLTRRGVKDNFKGSFPLDEKVSMKILDKIELGGLPNENKRILKSNLN